MAFDIRQQTHSLKPLLLRVYPIGVQPAGALIRELVVLDAGNLDALERVDPRGRLRTAVQQRAGEARLVAADHRVGAGALGGPRRAGVRITSVAVRVDGAHHWHRAGQGRNGTRARMSIATAIPGASYPTRLSDGPL